MYNATDMCNTKRCIVWMPLVMFAFNTVEIYPHLSLHCFPSDFKGFMPKGVCGVFNITEKHKKTKKCNYDDMKGYFF